MELNFNELKKVLRLLELKATGTRNELLVRLEDYLVHSGRSLEEVLVDIGFIESGRTRGGDEFPDTRGAVPHHVGNDNMDDDVRVGDDLRHGDNVRVGDDVHVGDDLCYGDRVRVGGSDRVVDNVRDDDNVRVGGDVRVGGGERAGVRVGGGDRVVDSVRVGDGERINRISDCRRGRYASVASGDLRRSSSVRSLGSVSVNSVVSAASSSARVDAKLKAAKLRAALTQRVQLAELEVKRRKMEMEIEVSEANAEEAVWDKVVEEEAGGAREGDAEREHDMPSTHYRGKGLRNVTGRDEMNVSFSRSCTRQSSRSVSPVNICRSGSLVDRTRGDCPRNRKPRRPDEHTVGRSDLRSGSNRNRSECGMLQGREFVKNDRSDDREMKDILFELKRSNQQVGLPKRELQPFAGRSQEYQIFKTAFRVAIGRCDMPLDEKLHFLYQHTSGPAKRLVEACLHMSPENGYDAAWNMLEKRYGGTEAICSAYIGELLEWEDIGRDDAKGLDKFAIQLIMTSHAVSNLPDGQAELDNPKTIRSLAQKLPFSIQESWRRKSTKIRQKKYKRAVFQDFSNFVQWEAEVASDPLYGREAMCSKNDTKPKNASSRRLVVGTIVDEERCLYCRGSHMLSDCEKFGGLTGDERRNLLTQHKMCYMCFNPGHMARECTSPVRCRKCNGWHQSVMHEERYGSFGKGRGEPVTRGTYDRFTFPQQETLRAEAPSFSPKVSNPLTGGGPKVMMTGSSGAMPVVPIELKRAGKMIVKTSALVDSGSAITICSQQLARRLGVKGGRSNQSLTVVTLTGEKQMKGGIIEGLSCRSVTESDIRLPPVYIVDKVPVEEDDGIERQAIYDWEHLRDVELGETGSIEMIIGTNVPAAMEPIEIRRAPTAGDPYALKTRLGWMVFGLEPKRHCNKVQVGRVTLKDVELERLVRRAFDIKFDDVGECNESMSVEDEKWLNLVRSNYVKVNNHYVMPLPLREPTQSIPSTKMYAYKRTESLKKRLQRCPLVKQRYDAQISEMLEKGYAEVVPPEELERGKWYLPHFHVVHPQKPNKVRVVFDCAAKVRNVCLNDLLISGPKLGSDLLNVLLRFREGTHALTADIEAMFMQVRVPPSQRDYLRFYWWGDKSESEMKEYRMAVHLFGATSSPAVASFTLQQAARDFSCVAYGAEKTVMENFYVDDLLKAHNCESKLVGHAKSLKELCKTAGFNLCKFRATPNVEFPEADQVNGSESVEKALGVVWSRGGDVLSVDVPRRDSPNTKRGLLSLVASIYDPVGIMAPHLMRGRRLIQIAMQQESSGWDDPFSEDMCERVQEWLARMNAYKSPVIPRSVVGDSESCVHELHVFADASADGHGAVAYVRVEHDNAVHCNFLLGKSRVNPMKQVSIPRLELVAALLAAELKIKILQSCTTKFSRVVLWTDSLTVLKYLRNEKDRFRVFVGNRVALIRSMSDVDEWRYVNSSSNPADEVSRGVQTERWLKGPAFLKLTEKEWPLEPMMQMSEELEVVKVLTAVVSENLVDRLVQHYSSWIRLLRGVSCILKFKHMLLRGVLRERTITTEDLKEAEMAVVRHLQEKYFKEELDCLERGVHVKKTSKLASLDVVLIGNVIRVGGRLKRANISLEEKHPIVLPSSEHVVNLLIRESHERLGHLGCATVLGDLRARYWILKGMACVKRCLRECVRCRKVKGPRLQQKMSDLPPERVTSSDVPFCNTGLDCFGPFMVKRGRGHEKRYGVIFTCMTMRAIHLEVAHNLSTDGLYNAIRRFLSRRGQVKKFFSDNGTNMVGARREIMKEISSAKMQGRLTNRGIEWRFNPPSASHFGGVWERMIRTVRRVLEATIGSQVMTDDGLLTLFCEAELAVNSRPLSVLSSSPTEWEVLTPNKLLSLGDCPDVWYEVSDADLYSRRRWRQVQFLAEQFWRKWSREYRVSLQERRKWRHPKRSLAVGDLVLLVDENVARCHWSVGRVVTVVPGSDGLVRSVVVHAEGKDYRRPVAKLVLILEGEDLI